MLLKHQTIVQKIYFFHKIILKSIENNHKYLP